MASGSIKEYPVVETLATLPTDVGDDKYITQVQAGSVYSFSQIHIYRYGKMVELNVVMTVKNTTSSTITKGTIVPCFWVTLKPMYTLRTFCFGAQGAADYWVSEGFISITAGATGTSASNNGRVSFIPIEDLPSGGVRTFRFNITYLTED